MIEFKIQSFNDDRMLCFLGRFTTVIIYGACKMNGRDYRTAKSPFPATHFDLEFSVKNFFFFSKRFNLKNMHSCVFVCVLVMVITVPKEARINCQIP